MKSSSFVVCPKVRHWVQVLGISLVGLSLVTCTLKGNIEDISNAEVSFAEPAANKYINTTNYDFKVQVNSSNIGITSDKAVVEVYESKECDPSKLISTTAFAASGDVGTSSVASLQDGKTYTARIIVKDKDKTFQSVCSGWIGVDLQKPNAVNLSYPPTNSYVTIKEILTAWNPTTDNGIAGLSDVPYRLRLYGQAACAGPVLQTADSADVQYKFKKLTQGVTYSVQVSAVDKATNESLIACSPYTQVDVNAPGFHFEDATSSSGYTRVTSPSVYFDNDSSASYWCLTQDLTFVPTNYTDPCPGGGGTASGWYTSRPLVVNLTPGDGLKAYDLWIVRGDGSLISNRKTSAAITLDQTLPGSFVVSGIGGISDIVFDNWLTSSGNPTIRWVSSADAVDYTLEIRTPGNALVCSQAVIPASPQEVTLSNCAALLDTQTYKIRMISYDVARNFVISPDFNFTVDRSFPGAFNISGITGGADLTADHFLGSGNPVVNFSVSSGATHYKIEVKDSGGSTTVCTLGGQVAPGGIFDYNTEAGVSCTGLTHGATYKAYVTAYNAGETATAASNNAYTFQVDTVVPTLSIDSHPAALTSDTFADFTFTAADAFSGLGNIRCQLDAAAYAPCTSPVHLTGVVEGVHIYNVRAVDIVGNVTTQSFTWREDLSNPVLTILSQPPAYLNSLAVGISFSATDAAGIAGYQCSMDGAPLSTCNSPLNFVTSEGPHSVIVRATDNTGFYDEKTVNFFADLTNPLLTITSQPPAFTSNSAISIAFSATDAAGIAGYKCGIDGAALSTCSSPLNFTATEGAHSVIVRATDNTGLYDEKTVSFRLDTINPVLTITSQPPAYTTNPSISIGFSATDAAGIALYECGIDGASLTVCSSPLAFTAAEGAHSVVVRATDNTAFYDEKTVTFRVDTTPPVLTINSQPPAFYNGTSPVVSFTASDAAGIAGFTCSLDGAALSACTSPYNPTIVDGTHTIKIRATDNTGLFSEQTVSFRSDTTNPILTINTKPATYINTTSVGITFSATDSAGIAGYTCSYDGAAASSCTSPQNFSSVDGLHSFTIRATDNTGLFDQKVATWTVDTIAPVLTISAQPPAFYNGTTPSVSFSATDADGVAGYSCSLDGAALSACSSPYSTTVADGTHTIKVRATDVSGLYSEQTVSFRSDTTNPILTLTSQPATYINTTSVSITFTATDAAGIAGITCSYDGAAASSCTSPQNFSSANGAHTFVVRATDNTGLVDQKTASWTVDTIPPVLTISAQPPAFYNGTTPSVSFSATDADGVAGYSCSLDGAALTSCSSPYNPTVADGLHTIKVRATDVSGLYSEQTVSFRSDTTNPVLTLTSQPTGYINTTSVSITFTATDAAGIASITCSYDGAAASSCTSPQNFSSANGAHTFVVRATDNTGRFDQKTASWTVDTIAPVITLTSTPTNPSNNTSTAAFSFTVADATATATTCSIDGGAYSGCASPANYSGLASGSHTFAMRATDSAGNLGTQSYTWTIYNYTWQISGFSGCTATQPAWSASGWSGCSVGQPAYSYGGWGGCSVGCGMGTQYRSEACNYVYGSQTQSVSCPTNGGTEYRSVQCQRNDGAVVADGYCLAAKPGSSQACSRNDCPGAAPLTSQACSRGGGGDCNSQQGTSQACNAGPCYSYTWLVSGFAGCDAAQPAWSASGWSGCSVGQPAYSYGGWGGCSVSCGSGTQYRAEACNYVYGSQTRSVSCPTNGGTEYRSVQCQRNDGTIVADGYCAAAKPGSSQACSRNDCPGGAPANSQGCSRGGGSDCNSQQGTSQGCYPGTCAGHWVYVGTGASGPNCSGYTSSSGGYTYAGAYSGYVCNVRPTICYEDDGKGGNVRYQCQ